MSYIADNESELAWYVSNTHCGRAIKYLNAKLIEKGLLPKEFDPALLLGMWGEALGETLYIVEPSPIGPDPEQAKEILKGAHERS